MMPPSASISRTRCPLAIPPIAGLQDIFPIRSRFRVSKAVSAPRRAAAGAASQPAWPAPITTTSKTSSKHIFIFQYRMSQRFARESLQLLFPLLFRQETIARYAMAPGLILRFLDHLTRLLRLSVRDGRDATNHDAARLSQAGFRIPSSSCQTIPL